MQMLAERARVMELVQAMPDEQLRYVLSVIQSLPRQEETEENDYSLETAIADARSQKNLAGPFSTAHEAVAAMLED